MYLQIFFANFKQSHHVKISKLKIVVLLKRSHLHDFAQKLWVQLDNTNFWLKIVPSSTTSLDILKEDGEEASNPCRQMSSCDDCIRHPECAWCADPDWDPVIHRHGGKFKLGRPNKIYTTCTDENFELNEMKKTEAGTRGTALGAQP